MSRYWEGVKARWQGMMASAPEEERPTETPQHERPDAAAQPGEWDLVHRKFRQIYGREPYSFQELQDWWNAA
jgi:hypothetical protein